MAFNKKEYDKKWYKDNIESRKESSRKYYLKNKEKLLKIHANYRRNNKFKIYKRNAKQRGHSFNITKEYFKSLIDNNCNYCNSNTDIGIDRIDSTIGYTNENCVSCCSVCNRMKGIYTVKEFINQCKLIIENTLEH